MSNDYEALLDATMDHLRALKSQGTQFVSLDSDVLRQLAQPVPAPRLSLAKRVETSPAPTGLISSDPKPTAVTNGHSTTTEPAWGEPLSHDQRESAMKDLHGRAMVCQKCPNLVASRKNVVFGVGNIHTELMFVGEAPGADEDAQGEPFVGVAGQLLTKIIQTMGYTRQTVYIANILKCRPDTPGQMSGNRKPTSEEMKTCLPYLLAQIEIIRPKAIVALGGTAVEGLFGKPVGIMKLRGNWQKFREIPVMPTYHPAYLLRNQSLSEKRKVWEDMLQVLEKLGQPISEKQRGYFLKTST